MECKCFKKENRFDFEFKTEKVKDYGEVNNTSYGDHVYYTLLQCPKCGAYFLHEEVEHISWSDGNDYFTDNFYQVESPEQADQVVEEGDPMFRHQGAGGACRLKKGIDGSAAYIINKGNE